MTIWRVAIGGLVGAVTVAGLVLALDWVKRKEGAAIPEKANAIESKILFDYFNDVLPRVGPQNGAIQIFEIVRGDMPSHLTNYIVDPGKQIDWRKFNPPWSPAQQIYRCDVTAIGSTPVFNASFHLEIKFLEVQPNVPGDQIPVGGIVAAIGNRQLRSGGVVDSQSIDFKIRRIDATTPYTFFIANRTGYFATLEVPKAGSAGQENQHRLLISTSSPYEMYFSPEP